MDFQDLRIAILCPIKNEEATLRDTLLSVLSQDFKNLVLVVVDNQSEDASLSIAKSISSVDPRVSVFKTTSSLSANQNWEFALALTLKNFEFDFLMFLGGDDQLVEKEYLSALMGKFLANPGLYGAVPQFIDQDSNTKVKWRLSNTGNQKIFELCKTWGYVHAAYGLYRRDCWDEIMCFFRECFDKGMQFDWWLSANLLMFPVSQVENVHYLKNRKSIPYNSAYYSFDGFANLGKSKELKKGFLAQAMIPFIDFFKLIRKTSKHFKDQSNFFEKKSRLMKLKMIRIFFFSGMLTLINKYIFVFKKRMCIE